MKLERTLFSNTDSSKIEEKLTPALENSELDPAVVLLASGALGCC